MNTHHTDENVHERSLILHVVGHSEAGRLLPSNGDAFVAYDLSDQKQAEKLGKLYLIADGTGGHAAEKTASQIAVETIPDVYYYHSDSPSPLGRLQQAFMSAHQRIREFAQQYPEYDEMTTTCTAVLVKEKQLWIAHVGDSRAYLIQKPHLSPPTITRLTTDHSLVAAQVRSGTLALEHMRNTPERDIFLRALGGKEESYPDPDFILSAVHVGDVLVLCSDGLWGAVSEEHIASVVSTMPPQQACQELVRLAKEARDDEDISVVLLSFSF